jgi:hypothetical protein
MFVMAKMKIRFHSNRDLVFKEMLMKYQMLGTPVGRGSPVETRVLWVYQRHVMTLPTQGHESERPAPAR